MELLDALQTRRAVREFTAEAVNDDLIEELIQCAILAPSAFNLQPWGFVVLRGPDRLHALSGEARIYAAAHLPATSPLAAHARDPSFEIFHGAFALVVVCAVNAEEQSFEDCCLAAENFMLSAHAKGLGTCWVGLSRPWLSEPTVKTKLGIPAEWHPVAPIILGHPKVLPSPTAREMARVVWCR